MATGGQGLSQAPSGEESSTSEGIGGRKGQKIQIPLQPDVREAVVEQKEIGSGPQVLERVETGGVAIGAHDDRDSRELRGEQDRLVSRGTGAQLRAGSGRDDGDSSSLSAVPAREDGHP